MVPIAIPRTLPFWRPREFALHRSSTYQGYSTSTAWVSKNMHYRASENLSVKVLDFVRVVESSTLAMERGEFAKSLPQGTLLFATPAGVLGPMCPEMSERGCSRTRQRRYAVAPASGLGLQDSGESHPSWGSRLRCTRR